MFGRKKSKRESEDRTGIDSAWEEDQVEPFFDGAAADHDDGFAKDADHWGGDGPEGDDWDGPSEGDGESARNEEDGAGSWAEDDFGAASQNDAASGMQDGGSRSAFPDTDAEADLSGLDVVVADSRPEGAGESEGGYGHGDFGFDDYLDDDLAYEGGSHARTSGYGESSYGAATGESGSGLDDDADRDDGYDDHFSHADDFGYDDEAAAEPAAAPAPPAAPNAGKGGKHAAHAAKPVSKRQQKKEEKRRLLEEMPDHERKSKRQRRGLTIVLVLLLVLVGALAYLAYTFVVTADLQPVQQQNDTQAAEATAAEGEAEDSGRTAQKTEVPVLVDLFGMTQDEAIEALGHGATVDSSQDVNEEGSAIKKRVGLKLTEEPGDAQSGQPTVYLGLNKDGKVVEASYSTATGYLGYGALSLSDIVENEHIVENTLSDAGLVIDDANLELPDDPSQYQTYDSDGTTLMKERVSFDGKAPDADGNDYNWSAVITYDYSSANASGNLADTVRQVYVTVKKP